MDTSYPNLNSLMGTAPYAAEPWADRLKVRTNEQHGFIDSLVYDTTRCHVYFAVLHLRDGGELATKNIWAGFTARSGGKVVQLRIDVPMAVNRFDYTTQRAINKIGIEQLWMSLDPFFANATDSGLPAYRMMVRPIRLPGVRKIMNRQMLIVHDASCQGSDVPYFPLLIPRDFTLEQRLDYVFAQLMPRVTTPLLTPQADNSLLAFTRRWTAELWNRMALKGYCTELAAIGDLQGWLVRVNQAIIDELVSSGVNEGWLPVPEWVHDQPMLAAA